MLRSLLPKAHHKLFSLPLLGPIADGFDDWLAASGYTPGSREFSIRMLPHVDADLRRRRIANVASLTPATLHACWRDLIKVFPTNAGTVHALERYLAAAGVMAAERSEAARTTDPSLSREYADHLHDVRGFAASTVSSHRRAATCFLQHLEEAGTVVERIRPGDIETYIAKAGKRLCRASLQHEIAALRGLLRFLSTDGRAPGGLDRQIDTPRLYRLEQLPRALPGNGPHTSTIHRQDIADGLARLCDISIDCHLWIARQRDRCHPS